MCTDTPLADEELLAPVEEITMRIMRFFGMDAQWAICFMVDDLNPEGPKPPNGGKSCTMSWPRHYRNMSMTWDRNFLLTAPAPLKQRVAAHELIHALFAQVEDSLQEDIGDKSYVWYRFHENREALVDTLTNLFSKAWAQGTL